MERKEYNGWTNYETWLVHLWLSNDQGLYCIAREIVATAHDEANECDNVPAIWTLEQAKRFLAEEAIKAWVADPDNGVIPELGATLASDLLNAALSEVDWQEIAEAFQPEEAAK